MGSGNHRHFWKQSPKGWTSENDAGWYTHIWLGKQQQASPNPRLHTHQVQATDFPWHTDTCPLSPELKVTFPMAQMVNLNISILNKTTERHKRGITEPEKEGKKESKLVEAQATQKETVAALRKRDNGGRLQFTYLCNIKLFSADSQRFLCKMLLYARMYGRQPESPEERDATHAPRELTQKGRERL